MTLKRYAIYTGRENVPVSTVESLNGNWMKSADVDAHLAALKSDREKELREAFNAGCQSTIDAKFSVVRMPKEITEEEDFAAFLKSLTPPDEQRPKESM